MASAAETPLKDPAQTHGAGTAQAPEAGCGTPALSDLAARRQMLHRLKRAEGQLRGIQRMIEEGQPCLDVASQMAAVRKALDSTYSHMVTCYVQAELASRLQLKLAPGSAGEQLMQDLQTLLGKVR
jgi:DNA-binding FrmR family transcriptional regulator